MKNISSMAALAALLLVSCGQDTDVKFAGDEGAKVTFSASINEQNSQDVSRVTGVTWDDGDEVSISCGLHRKMCSTVTMPPTIHLPPSTVLMKSGCLEMRSTM